MAHAVICPSCGAKYKANRDRCPRCRTRAVVVDPAAVAAYSRRLKMLGAGLTVVALTGIAGVWVLAPKATSPIVTRSAVDPLAARRPAVEAPKPKAPAKKERPYTDASGFGYESYQAGDFESALKHYQDAVARNPKDAESLSNLGQVLVRLGRPVDALPYFDRAVELNPDRWAYVFNRARAAALLERWTEAIDGYHRAQQLFPGDYATTYNLALTLHKSGNEEAAVVEYQKAIELSPEDGLFRRALAMSLERLNRRSDAAAAYAEYLRLTPNAPDADKVRERIALLTQGSGAAPKETKVS